ncbi:MAG TPA: septal ring lytic transglycosylase RlpA family protein [Stellaceae bacterium]|nr:septal ring lytic transglycosylase RlpA family protein [Stellaceae bacterium]
MEHFFCEVDKFREQKEVILRMHSRISPIFLGALLAIGLNGAANAEPAAHSSTASSSPAQSPGDAQPPRDGSTLIAEVDPRGLKKTEIGLPKAQAQTGKASWYGKHWRGKPTASGEPMNPDKLTAASKTLPIGSTVEVTNMKNGKTVRVRINDRGPYVKGRVIDLAEKAADQIGMKGAGVTPVTIRPIEEAAREVAPVDLN